jgi:hypothetical protein
VSEAAPLRRSRGRWLAAAVASLGAASAVLLIAHTHIEGRLHRTADEVAVAEENLKLEST